MGPNGSGKTTTANAILSNPLYNKVEGNINFESEDITNLKTDEIARKGVFMSFQLPEEIPGISVTNFLKSAKGKITGKPTIGTVSKGIEMFKNENNAVLIITHNTKILKSLKVDYVHILVNGKIVKTGDQSLAAEIEEEGYSKYKNLV